jgi:hypothetical protein
MLNYDITEQNLIMAQESLALVEQSSNPMRTGGQAQRIDRPALGELCSRSARSSPRMTA